MEEFTAAASARHMTAADQSMNPFDSFLTVSGETALRMMTPIAAYMMFDQEPKGSIEETWSFKKTIYHGK